MGRKKSRICSRNIVSCHLSAAFTAGQFCFLYFLTAKALLLIKSLSLAWLLASLIVTWISSSYSFLCEFIFFSVSCFCFILLSSTLLGQVGCNEINEGLCNFEWVSFNCDLRHSCCFRVCLWLLSLKSLDGRQKLDKSLKSCINFTKITVKDAAFYLIWKRHNVIL